MNEELISALARLIAGLHVPISLGLPLGTATEAYSEVRSLINDFGWSYPDEIANRLRNHLGE